MQNLLDKKFGKLTVIKFLGSHDNQRWWLCQCECGNTKELPTSRLNRGIKSCGCIKPVGNKTNHTNNKGGRKIEDLSNKKFGFLTALEPTNKRSAGSVVWKCKCDCGNIIYAPARGLKLGTRTSCGCVRSVGEKNISLLLQSINCNFIKEYEIFINDIDRRRFDFAIIENNIPIRLIEFDGPQHTSQQHGYCCSLL